MSDKYIFRRRLQEKYTVVANDLIRDTRLSWEARGLLIYLLSQKPEWVVRKTDLERQSQANDFVVSRILKELASLGYIYRERVQNDEGRFEWVTFVFDEPIPQFSTDGKPGDIVSTDKKSTTTAGDVKERIAEAIRRYEESADRKTVAYPADVEPYLTSFVSEFKREPAKQELGHWIQVARQWIDMGVRPEQVKRMYKYARDKGLPMKSPASITFAYDVIRQGIDTDPTDRLAEERRKLEDVYND